MALDPPRDPAGRAARTGARRLRGSTLSVGRLAGIPLRVDLSWFVIAVVLAIVVAPFFESQLPGLGGWAYLVGLAFAVLLYASVLLHELAHAVTGRRLGLQVNSITITLLGGLTAFVDEDPRPGRDAVVAAAGPLASLLLGGAAWYAALPLQDGIVRLLVLQLAFASLVVAAFNLLPSLPLDGGHLLKDAVWGATGRQGLGYVVAGRAGYVLSAVLLVGPWVRSWPEPPRLFTIVWFAVLAWFVLTGARQAVAYGKLTDRLPGVSAAALVRRVLPVRADLPLDQAVAMLHELGAAGIVVVDGEGRPRALVDPAAAGAVPPQRAPYVAVAAVARTLDPAATVAEGLTGLPLLRRLQAAPAPAHVVVDADGRVAGLLLAGDVDRVLATSR